jgi:LPXTG-site transpeptidase (sortase) family protein
VTGVRSASPDRSPLRQHLSAVGTLLVAVSLGGLAWLASGLADGALRTTAGFLLRRPVTVTADRPISPAGAGVASPGPSRTAPAPAGNSAPFVGGAGAGHTREAGGDRTTVGVGPPSTPLPFRPVTRVVVPRLALDAPVVPALLVERHAGVTWEVPAFKVGHAERTAGAGAPGNGVLVGHVTSQDAGDVFGNLGRVGIGDQVRVFSGAQAFDYRVTEVRTVARTDVSVVAPTAGASLSLITCTGPWLPAFGDFAERLVVRAELIDADVAVVASGVPPPPAFPPAFRTVYDERPGRAGGGDGSRRWPHDPASTAWHAGDGYRLFARRPGQFVALTAPVAAPLRDVAVTAAFRKVGGPPGGGYGLLVRDQGPGPRDGSSQDGRFYVFEAGDRGEVGVWRREDDRWVDLLPWTPSDAVRPGDAANELTVQAVGQRVTFLVNGSVVASLTDPLWADGAVGVFVGGDLNEVVLDRFVLQVAE